MPGFPAAADLPTPSTAKSSTSSREPHVPPFARNTVDILRFAALDMRKERQKHHSITKIQKHHIRATRQKHHSGARTENNTTAERKDKRTTAKRKDKGTTAWETLVGSSAKAACAAWRLARRGEAFGMCPLLQSTGSPLLQSTGPTHWDRWFARTTCPHYC